MQSGREGAKQRVVRRVRDALASLTVVEPARTGVELPAFLRASPLVGEDLTIERDRTPAAWWTLSSGVSDRHERYQRDLPAAPCSPSARMDQPSDG